VPVDRPDRPDDPSETGYRLPDDFRAPDAAAPLPLDQTKRAGIHRANRAQVEQMYSARHEVERDNAADATAQAGTDRGSWEQAVASLRAAWEQHQERYPERERATPRIHADGSWSSGDTRTLTPEQNAEATKACADIHDEGERVVFPAMRQIEAADPNRHLAGLEHMLKKADRLKEKVADVLLVESHLSPREALDKVSDAVRYTFTYSPDAYADGVRADIERLKAAGFEEIKLKNLWSSSQYKGINSQWRRPETGLRFEVQFHTEESLQAKELTHGAYERLRRPESETTPSERDELEEFQLRANVLLDRPRGSEDINDFPVRNL
jgi:hypothetical protein